MLSDTEQRNQVEIQRDKNQLQKLYVFVGDEPIKGKITVTPTNKGKKVEHKGMKIELIGQIGTVHFLGVSQFNQNFSMIEETTMNLLPYALS